ncbi:MAG: MarR family transcriptional regulator [Methanobacteriota archaeon]
MNYERLIFSIVMLSTIASATQISSLTVEVGTNGIVSVKEKITFTGGETESLIWIPSDVEGLKVTDASGPLSYELLGEVDRSVIKFNPELIRSGEVFVAFVSQHFTSKAEGVWKLDFTLPTTASRTIIKIVFPTNSTILNWTSYRFSVGPDTLWIYPDINETSFNAYYQFAGGDSITLPSTIPESFVWYLLGLVLVVVFILFILLKRTKRRRPELKETPPEKTDDLKSSEEESEAGGKAEGRQLKDSVSKMLEDNELKVVDVLRSVSEEEITQAQIYHTTGIPKASLSDIMNRLERRNIVERTREGRVKWVKLKKWVFK